MVLELSVQQPSLLGELLGQQESLSQTKNARCLGACGHLRLSGLHMYEHTRS